jgi:Oligosaccharyl transferase STT3 subunit
MSVDLFLDLYNQSLYIEIVLLLTTQEFWNWFDHTAWYPLGRVVGGTIYPGLMVTSWMIYNFLHAVGLPVNIRDVCVMLAPAFSGLTAVCVARGIPCRTRQTNLTKRIGPLISLLAMLAEGQTAKVGEAQACGLLFSSASRQVSEHVLAPGSCLTRLLQGTFHGPWRDLMTTKPSPSSS